MGSRPASTTACRATPWSASRSPAPVNPGACRTASAAAMATRCSSRLRLEAIRRRLCLGALSYAVHTHHRPHHNRLRQRSSHRQFHRAGRRRPPRAGYRFQTPYAGVTPYAACRCGFLHAVLQRKRGIGIERVRAVLRLALDSPPAPRSRLFDKMTALEQGNALSLRLRAAWRTITRTTRISAPPSRRCRRELHGEWRCARDQPRARHRGPSFALPTMYRRPSSTANSRAVADLCRNRNDPLRLDARSNTARHWR